VPEIANFQEGMAKAVQVLNNLNENLFDIDYNTERGIFLIHASRTGSNDTQ
jgi:hypothetical protein